MTHSTVLVLAAATWMFAPNLARADAPPTGQFQIESYSFHGDGCRQGSVAVNIAPDASAFTLLFDDFIVEATPSARQQLRVCMIDFKLKVPSGWSAGVATADVRGYASLSDPLSFSIVNSVYTLSGANKSTAVLSQRFRGPYDNNYQLRNQVPLETITFSPCGKKRTLRLRTAIRTRLSPRANNSSALMTVDSIDGEVMQKYGLVWKRCTRDDPDDAGRLPPLPTSFTAVCKSVLKQRQTGQILNTYEGSAVHEKAVMAQRQAESDANQQCRADRLATPKTVCELEVGGCQTLQN